MKRLLGWIPVVLIVSITALIGGLNLYVGVTALVAGHWAIPPYNLIACAVLVWATIPMVRLFRPKR